MDGEGFVDDDSSPSDDSPYRRKQVALQIAGDENKIERVLRQGDRLEVRAPSVHDEARPAGSIDGAADGVEIPVHAERTEAGARENQRVPSPAHGEVDRSLSACTRRPFDPFDNEGRCRIVYDRRLAQALLTAVGIGLAGLVGAAVIGLRGTDIARHVSFGFFSAMLLLLAHSMMMFYLIGKGKAVKDAMVEGGLTGDQYRRIAAIRKPVFSIGTMAMAVTIVAAILGASVDTGVLPPIVHAMLAYGAIAGNVAALRVEAVALVTASRIVDEVNSLLGP